MEPNRRKESTSACKSSGRHGSKAPVYACFLLLGTGCGWFVVHAIRNTLANVPEASQHGKMFGKVTMIISAVGLSMAAAFLLSLLAGGSASPRAGRCATSSVIAANVLTFALLALFWNLGAPEYPVLIVATVLGSIIAFSTFLVLFPLVSTFYGGWLIAPVRAGADLSCLLASLLAEAQNPEGTGNRFPMWILYSVYACMSAGGFVAWMVILRKGIGLRESTAQCTVESELNGDEGQQDQQQQQQQQQPLEPWPGQEQDQGIPEKSSGSSEMEGKTASTESEWTALRQLISGLACPRSLILPVGCATLSQVVQWSVVMGISQVGAHMTDPEGCDGDTGKEAYRTALTLLNICIPVGTVTSSLAECPRWLFYSLACLQLAAATAVVLATTGVGEVMWVTSIGRTAYIGCVAISAGLEGYILTMVYRYIGDHKSLPSDMKLSANSLLSFLSIVAVNPISITIGALVDGGVIACK